MKLYAVLIPQCEIPILVYADGTASNSFADGIVGVPDDWKKEAEIAFDPACDPEIEEED